MTFWQLVIVYASLCSYVSVGQNNQGSPQSTVVTVRTIRSDGRVVSDSRVPVQYFGECTVNGQQLQAGHIIVVQENSVPPCVTAGFTRYVGDLRSALQNVAVRLREEEKEVAEASNNNVALSIAPVAGLVDDTLTALDGDNGLLDVTGTLQILQPVVATVGDTLGNVHTLLSETTDDIGGLTSELTSLLGSTLNTVDHALSNVGSVVGGLGDSVRNTGGVLNGVVGLVTDPVESLVAGLAKGLSNLELTDLLNGKRR